MKKVAIIFAALTIYFSGWTQGVGVGTNTPHSSAIMELQSNNKGLLIPRMSTSQRKAIAAPATGLLVYDTDKNCIYMFDGVEWLHLSAGEKSNHTITRTSNTPVIDAGLGHAVCINGNYAVVTLRKQNGVGIDTAFVFFKSTDGWKIQAKLVASNGVAGDEFGEAVGITNVQLLVGAPKRANGGSVYAYSRVGEVWTQTAIITPSNPNPGSCFGSTIN
jgi:FG-GAP repeat